MRICGQRGLTPKEAAPRYVLRNEEARMLTKSEQLFERLCQTRGITFRRIPEGKTKTPDYMLTLSSGDVLVEVKQLDENDEDRMINRALLCGEETPGVECPSDRVRHKIAEAYVQLKAYCRAGLPAGIILYNNAGHLTYMDSWTVTKAMFGDYGYRTGIPTLSGGHIVTLGAGFMERRKVTKNTSRVLSFVAVMKEGPKDVLGLEVYHNPFAVVRLDPLRLSLLATEQFIHANPHDGKYVCWQPARIGNHGQSPI